MADLTGGRGNWVVALRPTGLMAGWLELHDLANPHDSVPEAADLKPQLTDLSKRCWHRVLRDTQPKDSPRL